MTYEELSSLVVAESNDIVYIADCDTYELLYLNRAALELLSPEESWLGKPCYQVLQGRDAPCEFCTNHLLQENTFYCWEHKNELLGKHFIIRDKLIDLEGRKARLEIAVDNAKQALASCELAQRLDTEDTLLSCIQTLAQNEDVNQAINSLLAIIGGYYAADRTYIFESNHENLTINNTYEWCCEGITPQKENLQDLPATLVDRWMEQFRNKGEFYISSLQDNVSTDTEEYAILAAQGIPSLIAAPLKQKDNLIGFLGVDNPRKNCKTLLLLRSVSSFIVNDISKRQMLQQLTYLSYTDSLTDVGNRHLYSQMLHQLDATPPKTLGVVFVDINGLKSANDTHGHKYGDLLICHIADMLRNIFTQNIFRIGGDEFVVLCPDVSRSLFNRRVEELQRLSAMDLNLHISIGHSWCADRINVYGQVSHTDELMYIDKQTYYGKRLDGVKQNHPNLSHELLQEIDEGRFLILLQPKVNLKTGGVDGAEALVRRKMKDGSIIPPNNFIPIYEAEGIIRHVDFYVLDTACSLLNTWRMEGIPEIKIAINLSYITLMESGIVNKLLTVCEQYQVSPMWIDIEVGESISTMEPEELKQLMQDFADAGFSISLDNFGAEYSNLAVLSCMDFNEVKLDKTLIEHIVDNPKSRVITAHTIRMCQELNWTTAVAEGVESSEQRDLLKEFDCDVGQGYFFDHPLDIQTFTQKYMLPAKEKLLTIEG